MGDPKKSRKKFKTPSHPWQRARIDEEKDLLREYGLKNKKEIWKMTSVLREFANRAKRLITQTGKQAEIEKQQMMLRLQNMGLINASSNMDDVMALDIRDILDRRLQTQVFKKNLARSVNQARQFITHGHITIGEKKITAPSYLVSINDEPVLKFAEGSTFTDAEHPERVVLIKKEGKKPKERRDTKKSGRFDRGGRRPRRDFKKKPEGKAGVKDKK